MASPDYVSIIAELDALSRTRALTLSESLRLERAIKEEAFWDRRKRQEWYWLPEQDRRARELRRAGLTYAAIAKSIGRSPHAVACRLRVHSGEAQ